MYKVLIVEDMDLTREDMIHLIEWEKHGFTLVPDARNGKIGLEYAMRYKPDIIITDIMMPVMSGLDMAQRLEEQGNESEVILLTAYEEFELAKRALKIENVKSFILKYEIDEEVLMKELNNCVKDLKKRKQVNYLKTRHQILEILNRKQTGMSLKEEVIGWSGKTGLILLRRLNEDSKPKYNEESIQEMLEERIPGEKIRLIQLGASEMLVLFRDKMFLSEMRQRDYIREFTQKIMYSIQQIVQDSVVAALGVSVGSNMELPDQFALAEERMQGYVFAEPGEILESTIDLSKQPFPEEINAILEKIAIEQEEDDYDSVRENISRLQAELIKKKNLYWLRGAEEKLMYFITHKSMQMESDVMQEKIISLKEKYWTMRLTQFIEQYEQLISMAQEWAQNRFSGKIRYIRSYVKKNYAKDITLNLLAEELGMNAIYLSSYFKKEMGMTFSAYLTDVRIEKAIELLKQGDYKIYEISEMVGYQTVQYFNKVFKRKTGKNPKDFC